MKVVVVESPSKAKTINKYLGSEYKVLASFGHVRDLPSKKGSVDPDKNFKMLWETQADSTKHVKEIAQALKGADTLYLATDPDREGEAISWHIREVLQAQKKLTGITVQRIVFHEITKKAVQKSLEHPRDLDTGLIEAYLTRRSLDYLVGFTLSPLLWTRLPGCRSAGRVQSVALRLVADRETEIEAFRAEEYWSLTATFLKENKQSFGARLTHVEGKKLEKFSLQRDREALPLQEEAQQQTYTLVKIEKKKARRTPAAPFITSTLQQEASRKLRFGARKTMQIAQRLYEGVPIGGETVGLITYMRTDSVTVATEALTEARHHILQAYGDAYVPTSFRVFKSKAKNAQEAHEAIRPTGVARTPASLKTVLDPDQWALYDLIWKRFVASQMEVMVLDQVAVDLESDTKKFIFRANGSTIAFDGFMRVYVEGKDEEGSESGDEDEKLLPPLEEQEPLTVREVLANQHFTQPPPRYSEASLVKKLEELGIGRPSTYASIMSTLLDRKYVRLDKRQLHPESLGRLVTAFLSKHFTQYLEYDFTADLEEKLDDISTGERAYLKVLDDFWGAFKAATQEAEKLRITDALSLLEDTLQDYIFPPRQGGEDPRSCPRCREGRLSLRLSKFGGYVGCGRYPDCSYTRQLSTGTLEGEASPEEEAFETKVLGQDPESGLEITLRKGPYGFYYQWGEAEKKKKPKRVSLPKGTPLEAASLAQALDIGALPRSVGTDPETGEPITAALGRFGPYVKRGSTFASLKKDDNVLTVSLSRALELLELAKDRAQKKAASAQTPKEAAGSLKKKATTPKTKAKATKVKATKTTAKKSPKKAVKEK